MQIFSGLDLMAPLTDEEAEERLDSMVNIINNEADIKVASLLRRERDLTRQKAVYVRRGIEAISAQYKKLEKKAENETKIYLLRLRNSERLKLLTSKDAMIQNIFNEVRKHLANLRWNNVSLHNDVFAGLILQGLLKIIEPNVLVVVRPSDKKIASNLMPKVMEDFHSFLLNSIPKETCNYYRARIAEPLETVHVLMESDLGGVLLVAEGGAIVIDNTLRKRFELLEDDLIPQLKHILFNSVLRMTAVPFFNPKYLNLKADLKPSRSKIQFKYSYISYPPNGTSE